MSAEIRAFLSAIAAAPEDDLPRLVFADWLDENGRPERAEFIRVEVQIARTTPGAPDRGKLFERRDALLKAHKKEWFALFDGKAEEYKSERGFVTAVRTGPEQFLAHADMWFGTQPITELGLTNVWSGSTTDRKCHAKEIFTSPHLGQLRVLDLHDAGVNAAGMYWMSQNPAITELQELNLRWNRIANEGARTIATIPALAKLKTLDLRSCSITDPGGRAIAKSPHLGDLRELMLSHNYLSPDIEQLLKDRYGPAYSRIAGTGSSLLRKKTQFRRRRSRWETD